MAAPDEDHEASPERDQTDESLRAEREKADDVIGQETSTDEAADAIIERARARADAVLLAARKKSDQESATRESSAESVGAVERKRGLEDQTLRRERAVADELVDVERAVHAAALASEREATDDDLSRERARADHAVAMRDEFLGVVSHDLRNMLGSIAGLASMIVVAESAENHGDRVRTYAERISRSVMRMNRLIGDLVDVASIEASSLTVTREIGDTTPIAMEAVDAFRIKASESGITIVLEVVPPPTLLPFDSARLLQLLVNLLSNALKFTPAGGSVVVRAERSGDELLFTVSDTGVGIPTEHLETVFGRFLQLTHDRRGVGLGLYISRSIVQGHGGRIWAERRDGGGSTFRFTLPIREGRPVTP